ncbi:MAG: hypothetical protein LKF69_03245 [Bacilli bacterium]|jgi:hypothetical protein|nr:hypothetical protein [Bacilli bacterium]MCH4235796.1 hypothetical protein [Bacilli bacterium]
MDEKKIYKAQDKKDKPQNISEDDSDDLAAWRAYGKQKTEVINVEEMLALLDR